MATEPNEIRRKTRRAKDLAIGKAIDILENPEKHSKEVYDQTYLTILKNTIPRTQEITGEEGASIQITFDSAFKKTDDGQGI